MDKQGWVIGVMLVMSATCFLLYVLQSLGIVSPKPVAPAKQLAERVRAMTPTTVPEMTDLLKAFTGLIDSLGKIGPTLTSLVGAIFFGAIATLASQAPPGAPPPPKSPAAPAASPTATPGGTAAPQRQVLPKGKPS